MSRSKHINPRPIRAARRILAPFEPRGAGDLGLRRRIGLTFKEASVVVETTETSSTPEPLRPRITVEPPSAGFHHPAGRKRVLEFIESLGPVARYGLRSIELVRTPGPSGLAQWVFGRYEAPGRILLFEQPESPLRLPGLLDHCC